MQRIKPCVDLKCVKVPHICGDVNLVKFAAVSEEQFESFVEKAEVKMLYAGEVEVFHGLFDVLGSFVLALAVDHDVEVQYWLCLGIRCVGSDACRSEIKRESIVLDRPQCLICNDSGYVGLTVQQLVGVEDCLIAKKTGQSKLSFLRKVLLLTAFKHLPIILFECVVQFLLRSLQSLLQKLGKLQRINIKIVVPALFSVGGCGRVLDDEVVVEEGGVLMYELEVFVVFALEEDGLGNLVIQFLVLWQSQRVGLPLEAISQQLVAYLCEDVGLGCWQRAALRLHLVDLIWKYECLDQEVLILADIIELLQAQMMQQLRSQAQPYIKPLDHQKSRGEGNCDKQ